jgi:hypothetical protein
MIIALDYDGTYTEDPDFWKNFIVAAEAKGHRVIIVTMRYASEGIKKDLESFVGNENVFYSSRTAKRPYMKNIGIKPNIWIDDHPQSVFMDAEQIWGVSLPEGHTDSRNAVRNNEG